jgi:toxin ParE1/3/4
VQLQWTPLAESDLERIEAYIGSDNPVAAIEVVCNILQQVEELLPAYPNIGRPGRVKGTREWLIASTPYIVVYDISATAIRILSVIHQARRWPERL